MQPQTWHSLTREELLSALTATANGLTGEEAARRLEQVGPNELQAADRISAWQILAAQFQNVLILILLVAVALSLVLGHGVESIVIAVIVLFAVLLGFVQEYRAERAIDALRHMVAPTATVLRDGAEVEIPGRDLLPGDVILLHTGDRIPADGRVLESVNLQVDEAALTGESAAVEKQVLVLDDAALDKYKHDPRVAFIPGSPIGNEMMPVILKELGVDLPGRSVQKMLEAWSALKARWQYR